MTSVQELNYGVDNIYVDSTLWQMGRGKTGATKDFINLQQFRKIKDFKGSYIDKNVSNNPLLVIFFNMVGDSNQYEFTNKVSILAMMGNVGGVWKLIEGFGFIFIFFFASNTMDVKLLEVFKSTLLHTENPSESLRMVPQKMDLVKQAAFQNRLWIYRFICCKSKCGESILTADPAFQQTLEFYNDGHQQIRMSMNIESSFTA